MTQQQLQTEVDDWVIVFMDRSVKFITKIQAEQIDIVSSTPGTSITGVDIDGGHYKFSTMAKVISAKDYYEQYPDRRPGRGAPAFKPKSIVHGVHPAKIRRMWEGSLKGIKKYISSKGGIENVPAAVKKRLQKIEKELKQTIYGK